MRNSQEISAALTGKLAELGNETDAAKRTALEAEVRDITNELQSAQIEEAAQRALANQRVLSPEEKKDLRNFSISKFLREATQGKLTGVEAEMNEEAIKEAGSRGVQGVGIPSFLLRYDNTNVTTSTEGQEFKATTRYGYIEALRNNLVAAKAGVQYIGGLQGNVTFVKGGTFSGAWLAEEGSASKEKPTFGTVTMSPKRLQVLGGYTMDVLKQSALSVDQIIWDELTKAHAQALDAAIFNGSGSSGQPYGIRKVSGVNSIALDTNGAALDFANLVKMETEVAVDNGLMGSLAYVTNAKVMGKLKTTAQIAGYPAYLFENGKANGYDVLVSNAIPSNLTKGTSSTCSSMIFGNFNECLVGQWGGIDFLVDPFSSKGKGVIEVTAIAYHDIAVKHPESFCIIEDILTA